MSEFNFGVYSLADDDWTVSLPHQCSGWDITDPDNDGYGGAQPVAHDVAVARMERFITEAQEALAALRDRREVDPW